MKNPTNTEAIDSLARSVRNSAARLSWVSDRLYLMMGVGSCLISVCIDDGISDICFVYVFIISGWGFDCQRKLIVTRDS